MTTLEVIILMLGIGTMNILCFLIGAKTGQKVVKGEEVTLPNVNPVKAIENYQEDRRKQRKRIIKRG